MSHTIIVGYDGSSGSESALEFAVKQAKASGASLVIAHVLEWSPYSFLTPKELEERHKRRGEELARAEEAILAPAVKRLAKSGVEVSTALKYGNIAEVIIDIATGEKAEMIVVALLLIDFILQKTQASNILVSAYAMKEGMLSEMLN